MPDISVTPSAAASHLLFDFFGPLVDYSPSRTEQGYEVSFALLREAGAALGYGDFLSLWSEVAAGFDAEAEKSRREFSMTELAAAFLQRAVGSAPEALVRDFVRTYLSEWNRGVRYPEGISLLLARLARRFTLAVVTNTHYAELVPAHLERMGVARLFRCVATSVEHGERKPAPEIFRHALRALGVSSARCVFVGDSYEADYLGARSASIPALLIDPQQTAPIASDARLDSVFGLEQRLLADSP